MSCVRMGSAREQTKQLTVSDMGDSHDGESRLPSYDSAKSRSFYSHTRASLCAHPQSAPLILEVNDRDIPPHEVQGIDYHRPHGYRERPFGRGYPPDDKYALIPAHFADIVLASLQKDRIRFKLRHETGHELMLTSRAGLMFKRNPYSWNHRRGLFRIAAPNLEPIQVLKSILRGHANRRAIIIAPNTAMAHHIGDVLRADGIELSMHTEVMKEDKVCPVAVGTAVALGSDPDHAVRPLIIYSDASTMFNKSAYFCWQRMTAPQTVEKTLIGILPYDRISTDLDNYLLFSEYGLNQEIVLGIDRVPREVSIAWVSSCVHFTPRNGHDLPDTLRSGVVSNRRRNQIAARLACAIACADAGEIVRYIPNLASMVNVPQNVLIQVVDMHHAELLRSLLRPRNHHTSIRVVSSLQDVDMEQYDVLIRADGGPAGLPAGHKLWSDSRERLRPLLVVDFKDTGRTLLRKRASSRKVDYLQQGCQLIDETWDESVLRTVYRPQGSTRLLIEKMNRAGQVMLPTKQTYGASSAEVKTLCRTSANPQLPPSLSSSKRIDFSCGGISGYSSRTLRRRSSDVKRIVHGTNEVVPPFSVVFDRENLINVLQELQTNGDCAGPDDIPPSAYSPRSFGTVIREVAYQVLAGCYVPGPSRTIQIPKHSGGHRTIHVGNVADRVIARALYLAVMPRIDVEFRENVYGFRPGRSAKLLLADLERQINRTQAPYLIQDDIHKAFDFVNLDKLAEDITSLPCDEQYARLITAISRGASKPATERGHIGIQQGNSISPVLLLWHLHRRHDTLLSDGGHIPFGAIYADNLVVMASTADAAHRRLAEGQQLLEQLGLKLKGTQQSPSFLGQVVDIRQQSVEVLGLQIRKVHQRVVYSIPDAAWEALASNLRRAHEYKDSRTLTCNIVRGWLSHVAPALVTHQERIVRKVKSCLREACIPLGGRILEDMATLVKKQWTDLTSKRNRSNPLCYDDNDLSRSDIGDMSTIMISGAPHPFAGG